jgi:hypothetical protein
VVALSGAGEAVREKLAQHFRSGARISHRRDGGSGALRPRRANCPAGSLLLIEAVWVPYLERESALS